MPAASLRCLALSIAIQAALLFTGVAIAQAKSAPPTAAETALPEASITSLAAFQKQVKTLLQSKSLAGAKASLCIEDIKRGTTLFCMNGHTPLVPGSTTKLVTTTAALHILGPNYRFPTKIYAQRPLNGTVVGPLVIKGYGDPEMTPERLWYLAKQLHYRGVKKIQGDVLLDDSFFSGSMQEHGWRQDLSGSAYMAPVGALSVGYNAIGIHVRPAHKIGKPALIRIEPTSPYISVLNQSSTRRSGKSKLTITSQAINNSTQIKITGTLPQHAAPHTYWRQIYHPTEHFAAVLGQIFRELNIQITGRITAGRLPVNTPELMQIESPRLAEITNKINKFSNNFMAAQIARVLGVHAQHATASWKHSSVALRQFLEQHVGLAAHSYTLSNASGLHDVNRLSTRQLIKILRFAHQSTTWRVEFMNSLAVAGGSGTLIDRMRNTAAQSVLRAKTGTLSIASALAGYTTTRSKELLGFAIIVNHYRHGLRPIIQMQDTLGTLLARLELPQSTAHPPTAEAPTTAPPHS